MPYSLARNGERDDRGIPVGISNGNDPAVPMASPPYSDTFGVAPGRYTLRSLPYRLPLHHLSRGHCHLLAVINES